MEITNLGGGTVKLASRKFSMIIAPAMPRATADVIALTQPAPEAPTGDVMVLDGPGEYEVGGVLITGVAAQLHIDPDGQRGVIYVVDGDEGRVACLGNIAPGLSNQQLEAMGQVDALIIPVGGHGLTLDAQAAAQIVSQVEPKVVIPIHYEDGTKYEMPQDKVDAFIKELGATPTESSKYKLSAKDLPEEMDVVVLKPGS